MESTNLWIEKYKSLMSSIATQKKFGMDCEEELLEAEQIKNKLIHQRLKSLNDKFINSHSWENSHLNRARPWDIFIYEDMVCRIKEIKRLAYNEGNDTYNYEAIVGCLFMEKQFSFQFNYYHQEKFLKELF